MPVVTPFITGYAPFYLAQWAADARHTCLHITHNDARMTALCEAIQIIAPNLPVYGLPAWDCLPFDRVSPSSAIIGQRLQALHHLAANRHGLVIATANAMAQAVPDAAFFQAAVQTLRVGDTVNIATLRQWLSGQGYLLAATVRERGEYAVRGGILDIFLTQAEAPCRLDFFGDTIEHIRQFDPASQRSLEDLSEITLSVAREFLLDEASITRFRHRYRALASVRLDDDPLYAAVSAGQWQPGLEHWLPLFHEQLVPVSQLNANVHISYESDIPSAMEERIRQAAEYHEARCTLYGAKKNYHPVAVADLYGIPPLGEAATECRLLVHGNEQTDGQVQVLPVRPPADFTAARVAGTEALYQALVTTIRMAVKAKQKVVIATSSTSAQARLVAALRQQGLPLVLEEDSWQEAMQRAGKGVGVVVAPAVRHGFISDTLCLITEEELYGDRVQRKSRSRKAENFLTEASTLSVGDYVVHEDHGIGRYAGLEAVTVTGAPHDCIKLLYAGDDKLFVPVENMNVLARYANEEAEAVLDKLGGVAWQARKAKVKERIRAIAHHLLATAAQRALREGVTIIPDAGSYDEFCARFPFVETDDQLNATRDVLADMASGKPMDRLICGDVGFGKTEVAMRAAFAAVLQGLQVAVIVPTTLLARQHLASFQARFSGFPVRIGGLSRLIPAKEAALVKQEAAQGTCDIIIGTHALLAKDMRFKRLGLVIVDEEQHFGVAQKERLKAFKADVHVLTLSATPIPRTLQMALSGVREMSLIATPPVDRLVVRTYVAAFDAVTIRDAVMREYQRGGQVFVVCPRIKDLADIQEQLATLVPEVKITMAHGRTNASQLEEVMTAFLNREFDVLLSTQIIESGIDISNANTLIIVNAHLFGLAQLYQLRGRVGRGKVRGYAYLTLPADVPIAKSAMKRLEVMQTLDHLGAGFTLASHDMDLRGAGNLLGDEQSGHIREVGIELYQQMLQDAVNDAKASAQDDTAQATADWTPAIQLAMPVLIPESYVADLDLRMGLYRRAANLLDAADVHAFRDELLDRFGKLPREVENLLALVHLKRLCLQARVDRLDAGPKGIVVGFRDNSFNKPEALLSYVNRHAGMVKLRPDQRIAFAFACPDADAMVKASEKVLLLLAEMLHNPAKAA